MFIRTDQVKGSRQNLGGADGRAGQAEAGGAGRARAGGWATEYSFVRLCSLWQVHARKQ